MRGNRFLVSLILFSLSSCSILDFAKNGENDHYNKYLDNYIFFTDPHMFASNNAYEIDFSWFDSNIQHIGEVYDETNSKFLMCGGDLLNNNDTYGQAMYKLAYFRDRFYTYFNNFHIVVGNHDTNYQGDTLIKNGNYIDCILSEKDLDEALFYGSKSYYYFDSNITRYYCFNSGIDWDYSIDEFKTEQMEWFANDLLSNSFSHSVIFIHIAVLTAKGDLSSFILEIGKIIEAYNNREVLELANNKYDYTLTEGKVEFIQAGHRHVDLDTYSCGGVPIIVTRNYGLSQPTFDYVCVDYNENKVICKRYGNGEDRIFDIS